MKENNSNGKIVDTQVDASKFMESIVQRTVLFLAEDAAVNARDVNYELSDVQKLQLKEITSIITVEDDAKMTLAFSFDRTLIYKIFVQYSQGIEIDQSEIEMYIEETAGDMINIVLGNVLAQFQRNDRSFAVSTPLVTSHGQEAMVLDAIEAGAKGYLLKPIRIDNLKTNIEQIYSKYGRQND